MLWCHDAQDIGISSHKLKFALTAPYDHNARPFQMDRQTDGRTDGRTSYQ